MRIKLTCILVCASSLINFELCKRFMLLQVDVFFSSYLFVCLFVCLFVSSEFESFKRPGEELGVPKILKWS